MRALPEEMEREVGGEWLCDRKQNCLWRGGRVCGRRVANRRLTYDLEKLETSGCSSDLSTSETAELLGSISTTESSGATP